MDNNHPSIKCDLFLGSLPVDLVEKLLKDLSLLNSDNKSWWDNNVEKRMNEFEQWIGSPEAKTKVAVRKHVATLKYKSILDCGCGLCSEYHGYKNDKIDIEYHGLDSCLDLVKKAKSDGINVIHGSIQDIPLPDSSVDITYTRHVLEHIFDYKKALIEMIRVASKEVVVTFFIPPKNTVPQSPHLYKFDINEQIWHNQYQKFDLELFIVSNPKVASYRWTDLPEINESILHIVLKEPEIVGLKEPEVKPELKIEQEKP